MNITDRRNFTDRRLALIFYRKKNESKQRAMYISFIYDSTDRKLSELNKCHLYDVNKLIWLDLIAVFNMENIYMFR
jgi:hypothetical protein